MTPKRTLTRALLLFSVACTVLFTAAAVAFAGPASTSWIGESPAPGVQLTAPAPIIGVNAFSTAALQGYSAQITVDGVAYKTLVSNPQSVAGHWTYREVWDDDAEEWTAIWTWVVDPDLTKATISTYANGTNGVLGTDGTHTVTAKILNASGTVSSDTWSYSIRIAPVIGAPTPAPGSQVDTATPAITIPISDNGRVASWNVTVNGAPATATLSAGALHVTVPTALPNDARTNVAVTVTDGVGASSSYSWGFDVLTNAQMLNIAGECPSCHPGYENDPDMGAWCLNCHAGLSAPHVGTPESLHGRADSTCQPCHLSAITNEHARWTTQAGSAVTCLTCHQSTDPKVTAAIKSGNSNCGGCHDTVNPHAGADLSATHTATNPDAHISILGTDFGAKKCADCHTDMNVATVHGSNCATCHPSPRDSVGTWNETCVTGGCHTAGSTKPMHQQIDAVHTGSVPGCTATGCHAGGVNIALIHQAQGCDTCHADGTTPTATCTECHDTTTPHSDNSGDHLASPAAQTISISGKSFGSHECSECHSQMVLTDIHGTDCSKCHPTLKNSLTPSWDRSCAQGGCHTAGSTKPMHGNIDGAHTIGAANASCKAAGCHTSSVADIHSAATTTVAGATRTSCQICHAEGVTPTTDCASCHGDTTALHSDAGAHTAAPASVDATIEGVDYGPLVCSDCHDLNVQTTHASNCVTCHPTPRDSLTPAWDKSCSQGGCHTAGSSKRQHGDIDSAHVVPIVGCTAVGCHADRGGSLAALHSGVTTEVAGVTRTSCQICHAAGVTPTDQCSVCHDMTTPHTTAPAAVHQATFTTETVTILGANVGDHGCGECHASNSLTDIHDNVCQTCHPTPRDTLTPSWDKSCSQGGCHTAGSSKPKHGNIDAAHSIGDQSCLAAGCHTGTGNLALVHSQATTTVAGVTLTSCQICHADGRTPSKTCTDCHDTDSPHPATTTHTTTAPSCSTGPNCHNMNPGDVRALHNNKCEDCHDRDDNIQPSTDCSVCHGSNTAYSHGYEPSIHSADTTGSMTIVGTTFDNVVCADCHNPASETVGAPNGVMTLGPLHDNGCPSCHPGVVPNVVSSWNNRCDQAGCHSAVNTAPQAQPLHVKADGTTIDQAHSMVPVAKDCLAGGRCHTGTSLPQIHANATLTENGVTYNGCQVCHKKSLNIPVVPDFTSPDGSVWQNECLGCHPDRWAQHGYTGSWHTSTVTTAAIVSNGVTVNDATCADCHARGTETAGTPNGVLELGPIHAGQNLGCDNCHPTPRDTFVSWNKTCDEPGCHGATSTQPMHQAADSAHTPTPGTSCMIDGCHLRDTTAPGWGADLPQIHQNATTTVGGKTVKGCMVCHFNNEFNPNGSGVTFSTDSNGVPNTKECAVCHPQGNNTMHAYSFINHTSAPASETITIGSTNWGPMPCTRCHFTELSSEHARNISGFKSNGCFNCHPDPYNSLEAQGQAIGGWNKGCVQAGCHNPTGANAEHHSVTASHTPLPQNSSCMGSTCHSAGGSGVTLADIHSQATTTVAGKVRTQCDVCHGDYATQSQPPSADCTYCHADKVLAGGAIASHINTDTLHPTTSATGCSQDPTSCHSPYLAKEHFRRTPSGGGAFTCSTCHDSNDSLTKAAIKAGNTACEACHTTHHGQQTPASNSSCQDCHGTTSTEISAVATSGVYANTGGDHQTGFSSAAHSSIQTTPTLGTTSTTIQCTVCHDHSRTTVPKYINYRYTGWPDPAQNHEDLCFQCHTSTTTAVNEPNKPNTWNGRSVQAQFQLASKHTISTGAGSLVDQEIPNFADTTQAQFNLESRSNVTVANVSGGEVLLAQDLTGGVNPPAVTNLLFGKVGGSTAMDQYSTTDGTWDSANTAKFTPAAAPGSPATGASAFRVPGDAKVYFPTASTCYVYTPPADPTMDSWTTNTNFAAGAAIGAGGDTTVDTTGTATTGQCVYYLRGGSTNYIYMKPYAGSATAAAGRIQYPSGTTLNQGAGSAIAFSPTSNRVFVINRNGAAGDGKLYYYAGLNRPSGTTTSYVFTQGPSITTSTTASTVYNRLTCATIGGTDYLFSVGPNMSGSLTLQVVTNVASTPTLLGIGVKPPTGWTGTGDGCDLKYNAADGYLYAIRGGSSSSFARIQVPANPGTASSWTGVNWQALTTGATWAAGSSFEFADGNAPTITPFKYYGAGTLTSGTIAKVAGSSRWGKLTFNGTTPVNTAMSVKVEGLNSGTSSWDTLVASAIASPVDLSSFDCTTYPSVRLTATLSTNDPYNSAASPQLYDWSVTNIKQTYVPPSGSLIQCENCHNTHMVQKGSGVWDKKRVVDPTNVKLLWTGTWADFCLKCHTGTNTTTQALTPMISATSIIPYNVAFRPVTAPLFTGFNKTITGMDWSSAGHNPLNGVEGPSFTQTTASDFTADTRSQTTVWNTAGGEVKIAQNPNGQPNPVAQNGVAFVNAGGSANFDQYLYDSWDTTNTLLAGTPTAMPAASATGANSFRLPGDNSIYVMTGSSTYQYTPGIEPSWDSWTTNANLVPQRAQAIGCDSAVNGSSGVIYTTRSGANATIYTRLYASPYTASSMTFSGGSLGAGSGIAYAPTADRLFVVNKNAATSADGKLYYLAAPGVKSGNQTFTAGPQLTASGTTSVTSRITVATVGGTDYLFFLGPNSANAMSFQVCSNLGSAPTTISVPVPAGWTGLGDGCDLEYNAADGYLYAIRGGGLAGFARILVPATPGSAGSWGSWQALSQMRSYGAGTTLSFANVDPIPGGTYTMYGSGTVQSPDIAAPNGSSKWGNLTFTSVTPANTSLSITVQGYNSNTSAWDTLIPATSVSPTSLKIYSTSLYTKLRLVGNLGTTATTTKASNPEIDDWTVTAYSPSSNSPSCNNCHDPHGSNNQALVAYTSLDGTTQRDNSAAIAGSGLCYKCHGTGTGTKMDVQAPATSTYGHPIAASGAIHNDEETTATLLTSRHADCSDCHNPHAAQKGLHTTGSSNAGAVLNGVVGLMPQSWPSNWSTQTAGNYKKVLISSGSSAISASVVGSTSPLESALCFKCHTNAGGNITSTTAVTNSGTYSRTDLAQEFNPNNFSFHNVIGASTAVKSSFTFTDNGGTQRTQAWPIPSAAGALKNGLNWNSQITCSDCHTGGSATQAGGPHGSSVKWMLDPNYAVDWETVTWTTRTSAGAYICTKCHDMSVSTNSGAHGGNHNSYKCIQCHIAIPHGWKRPRLLGYTTDPAPYWKGGTTGLNAISSTFNHSAGAAISWSQNDCGASGCSHGTISGTSKWN